MSRFIVTQIGARRGYSVPAALESAGMLDCFYTDVAGNVGVGKWLVKLGPLCGFKNAAQRLANRRLPDSIKHKTVTFALPGCWPFNLRTYTANGPRAFRRQLRRSHALGRAMARRGFGQATHLYSMMGECSPLLAAARRAGLTTVTEFFILLSTERILSSEQNSFPDWEPPAPDLDAVRREFPCEQQILHHTCFAICPSDRVRTDLEQHFAFPPGRSAIVPYGIDPLWLAPSPHPVPRQILFVGTAGLRKGIHYLAAAAELLHAKRRRYDFRVAGDVTPRIACHPRARFLRFLGRLPRHQIQDEFLRADLFVLPSLAEGSAEATYEALAAGLPVITTSATGSVARHDIDGFVVPPRNAAALAARIEQLTEDRPLRNRMAIAARDRARQYTFEHYGRLLVSALRSFVA